MSRKRGIEGGRLALWGNTCRQKKNAKGAWEDKEKKASEMGLGEKNHMLTGIGRGDAVADRRGKGGEEKMGATAAES